MKGKEEKRREEKGCCSGRTLDGGACEPCELARGPEHGRVKLVRHRGEVRAPVRRARIGAAKRKRPARLRGARPLPQHAQHQARPRAGDRGPCALQQRRQLRRARRQHQPARERKEQCALGQVRRRDQAGAHALRAKVRQRPHGARTSTSTWARRVALALGLLVRHPAPGCAEPREQRRVVRVHSRLPVVLVCSCACVRACDLASVVGRGEVK